MSGLLSEEYVDARAREMRIASLAKRVLFIGNSLTFWNQGVDVMVKKLVPGIETKRVAVGGATLETLWSNDEAKLACASKDIVVLQEDLPETSRESFRRHAKLWCEHVRKYGAEPVFYVACCVEINQSYVIASIASEIRFPHRRRGPTTACRLLMMTRSARSTRAPRKKTTRGSRTSARHARRDQKG